MADTKVTGLTENTTPAATDIIYIVDDPGGTPASQKVTLANIKALVNDITSDAEWDAKGDLVAGTGANTADRLAVGANNTVLMADSGEATGLKWSASPIVVDTVWDAKGDLVGGTGANTAARLAVGVNGTVLTADSGETTGLKWAAASGSVATDAIWDAAGDIVQGTGANTASRLAVGTAFQILRVNSGATAVEWVSAGRVLLQETSTTGSTNTVTLASVSNIYRSIEVEITARSDRAGQVLSQVNLYLNNDTTGTNYRYQYYGYDTNTTLRASGGDSAPIGFIPAASSNAGSAGVIVAKINDYKGTTWNKTIISQNSARLDNTSYIRAVNFGVEWESTVAVTRLDVVEPLANFVDGSIVRFYGVF